METKILNMDMKFIFENEKKILQIHKIKKCLLVYARIYESLAGCRTMVIFAVFCKIGALERNAY